MAYNTLLTAFKDGYTVDVEDKERWDAELDWLQRFWDGWWAPCRARSCVARSAQGVPPRQHRGLGTLIHAYIRLANHLREHGLPPETVRALADLKVTLSKDGLRTVISPLTGDPEPLLRAGATVGYFSPDNPLWAGIGVVVTKAGKDGSTAAEVRNAFQTREAAARALLDALAPAMVETKQEAIDGWPA